MALTYLKNRRSGTPVVTNMAADLSNPNYTSMHGAAPKLGGGSTPQLRYAQQQQNDANSAYNAQQMALANMKNSQMYAPQLANYANADQIAADQAALGKDMSDANNRLNAKYAAMRLNSNLDENNRYQQAMQGMMGQQADMAKFNAQQYADQKNMAAKMAFDQAQQERGFGNEKDLTQMKINADNAQFDKQLSMKPTPLTPYEEAKQKAQAAKDVELAGKQAEYGKTQSMLDPNSSFGSHIENLINQSTGSSAGNAIDKSLGAFGYATPGAVANSELATFANQLVMQMPRGSGPQSDRDMAIAQAMAGDLANPNKTVEEKLAALKGVRNYYDTVLGQGSFDKLNTQSQQEQSQISVDDLLKKYGG